MTLLIVGGGRMGEALLGGLLAAGWEGDEVVVVEPVAARRDELADAYPDVETVASPIRSEGAVIAVKPADAERAVGAAVAVGTDRVLSVAAGVTLARLEAAAGPDVPVVRAMPNTAALVGEGAAAVAAGSTATEPDLDWAEAVLGSVGTVVRVPESMLDAVTGLSGSGPAYVCLVAEALVDAGVLVGLPRPTAEALAYQTLLGTARLVLDSDVGPAALRAAVTSPGGTTAAGVRELERHGVRVAFLDAVAAATERSRQLGGA